MIWVVANRQSVLIRRRTLHPLTQPQGRAQHAVDAGLPAVVGGAQRGQHIGVEPPFHCLLGGDGCGAAAAHRLFALIQIGLLQPGFGDLRRIIRVNPGRCRWFGFRVQEAQPIQCIEWMR